MMVFFKKCFFLFALIIICSCIRDNKESIVSTQSKSVEELKSLKVWFIGIVDDPRALNSFGLHDQQSLRSNNYYDSKVVNGDSIIMELDSISTDRIMEVSASGKDSFYKGKVFITPGDTVFFEIKDKKLIFHGENANKNNFYNRLYDSTAYSYFLNPYKGDLYNYKNKVDSIYKIKLSFLNDYVKRNDIESKEFFKAVEGDLKHEYLLELIQPRNIDIGNNFFGSRPDEFVHILNEEYQYGERLFDYNYYFNNVSVEDFKDLFLLHNSKSFKRNINAYIRYYFNSDNIEQFTKKGLLVEKRFIEENFKGEIKKFAIAKMIYDYERKGFGYSINNKEVLKSVIKEYENEFLEPSYKKEMIEIVQRLETFDFKLSKAALNANLLSKFGDTITLKEIFERSSKRIKVIDFWASWCSPCVSEIKKGKGFKDKLAVEHNVEWIYLSIDKEQDKWLKMSEELSPFLNVSTQYMVLNGNKSPLAKSLKVVGIPRYIILNHKNSIVLENSPRPSDTLVFKRIIESIK
jgi:thiol-disulfide isomerase/thioredoxin